MLKDNEKLIYKWLNTKDFITADALAKKTKLSNRTVRNCIASMKEPLKKQGVFVVSKPRFGYKLEVFDEALYEKESQIYAESDLPMNVVDRERYLSELLISENDYIKIDDISEFLYVSRGTITRCIKNIEIALNKYNLTLLRKPNKGIKIVGKERDFRKYIEENIAVFSKSALYRQLAVDDNILKINNIINEVVTKHQMLLPEATYLRLMGTIYIQVCRIESGNEIKLEKKEIENYSTKFWDVIAETANKLSNSFKIEINESEKIYLYLNFISKGIYDFDDHNVTIRNNLDELVSEMLEEIYNELQIDFRNDFELRMQLAQHLLPMEIRMKYDFYSENPLIDEIKTKYTYAFNIASQSIVVLVKKYNKYIPQDEVGYLALIFQLAIERSEKEIKKLNILIICASGKGSSQLLKYKYKQEFSAYLNNIYVCDLYQLKHFDYSKVDYVFTTVPITSQIPLPIHEISLFLDDNDIVKVKRILSDSTVNKIEKFYKRNHFIPNLKANNKFEAIKRIVEFVSEKYQVSSQLYDSIIARENMAPTEFGNHIAMPHTMELISMKTLVFVAILDKPILWNKKEVQVIILTILGKDNEEDMQVFYEVTTNLFYNSEGVKKLIKYQDFDYLFSLLSNH